MKLRQEQVRSLGRPRRRRREQPHLGCGRGAGRRDRPNLSAWSVCWYGARRNRILGKLVVGVYLQAFSWGSGNPTHCHPKLCQRSDISRIEGKGIPCLRFYKSSKRLCSQPEIRNQIVSPLRPHVKLAKFAELVISRGNLHF